MQLTTPKRGKSILCWSMMLTSRRSTLKWKTLRKVWEIKTRISWIRCLETYTAPQLEFKSVTTSAKTHIFLRSMSSLIEALGFSFARRFFSTLEVDYILFQTSIKGPFLASSSRWETQRWTTLAFIPRIMIGTQIYLNPPPTSSHPELIKI
jgi:hypothetical protein